MGTSSSRAASAGAHSELFFSELSTSPSHNVVVTAEETRLPPAAHASTAHASTAHASTTQSATARFASKVPAVTAVFWLTKVLTTGMGETASDFFATAINPIIAVGLAGLVLVAALVAQLRATRYVAWIYWGAVVMVSIFGTMVSDVVHVVLGVPYWASTIFFAVALAAIFALWHRTEQSLSIHGIRTTRRELFYWTVVLTTFALGTAAGDLTATSMHLGYFASGILFAVLIAVPAVAHWKFGLNAVAAFWIAYVLTRPLGASFSDWVAVSHARGGLGMGTGPVSLVMVVVIAALVGYLAVSKSDVDTSDAEAVQRTDAEAV